MGAMEFFPKRLKALREHVGLTQEQLAKKLGVSRGSISYYENGDRIPDIEFLHTASEYFDVSYDFLLGGKVGGEKEIERKLCLSSDAIDAIEALSRTIDEKTGVSMTDVLNELLLNPLFEDLLFQLNAASNIDEEEVLRLRDLTKKHLGTPIDPTIKAASKLRESITTVIMSGIYNDFKNNPVKPSYSVEQDSDGSTIYRKSKK